MCFIREMDHHKIIAVLQLIMCMTLVKMPVTNSQFDSEKNSLNWPPETQSVQEVFSNNNETRNDTLSEICQRDYNRYKIALRMRKIWALRMADASGKFEAGFLEGNKYFEGDFKQCDATAENSSYPEAINGLYCTTMWHRPWARWSIVFTKGRGLCLPHTCTDEDVRTIVYREDYIKIPTSTTILTVYCARDRDMGSDAAAIFTIVLISLFILGVLCISIYHGIMLHNFNTTYKDTETKQGCFVDSVVSTSHQSNHDAKIADSDNLNRGDNNSTFEMESDQVNLDDEKKEISPGRIDDDNGKSKKFIQPNQVSELPEVENSKHSYDMKNEDTNEIQNIIKRYVLCFSLFVTVPHVVSARHPPGSYRCINAIRFLSMCWVMLGHSWTLGYYYTNVPVVRNRYPYYDYPARMAHWPINNTALGVEPFFVITAFLVTTSFLKAIERQKGKITARQMVIYYVHRYWRLTPVYMVILMFYANLFYYFGKGPFFRPHITDVDRCKEIWWKNMLYINNLARPQDGECMGQSWYLANDFQFYCMAPLFLITFSKNHIAGIILTILGFCGSTIANLYILCQIYINGVGDYYYDVYIRPWTHSQTFFMGIILGYIIYKTNGKVKMNKYIALTGWILAAVLCYIAVYAQYFNLPTCDGVLCSEWTQAGTVVFLTVRSPLIGLSVVWTIFACVTGHGGIINTIFSWNGWVPLSKLTYVAYLFHPILMFFFAYGRPIQLYVYDWLMVYIFCGHLVLTLGAAFIITLIFEVPLMKTERVFLAK